MPAERNRKPADIRADLAKLRARPAPITVADNEARRESEYYLQLELDEAEGRPPSIVWTHKGVL